MNWGIRNPWARWLEIGAVAVAYYLAGRIGLAIPFTLGNVSPVWPAAGIALGSILLFGPHVCLGVAIGAFLVNLRVNPPLSSLMISLGTTAGPALGALLLRRKSFTSIKRVSDVFMLLLCGSLGLSISALVGALTMYSGGNPAWGGLGSSFLIWWLGDSLGVLLVTPLIVNAADFRVFKLRWIELVTLGAALLVGSAALLYRTQLASEVFYFALVPLVIWGAVRFSIPGAAVSSCVLTGVAVWETAHGAGPFVTLGHNLNNAAGLQLYVGVLTVSGLSLAAVLKERATAQEALAREEKLRRAQEQYRIIVETTNDGVWLLDAENRTVFVNRRMTEMMGYTAEEMLGRTAFEFVFPEDLPRKFKDLHDQRTEKEAFYDRVRRKDGSELWILCSTNPIFSENGQLTGILGMFSDVTQLRKTEETLLRNEKLVAAGRLAATISHEVNNPLEAVINLLYLLQSEPMSAQGKNYLRLAEKELQRVSAITRRTLGFFRDTSAEMNFSLPELLDETIAFYEPQFAAHGVRVVRDYRSSGVVRGLRGEIQQVFANLISNALDAMDSGGLLTMRVNDTAGESGRGVQIEVGDTGPGIAAANLERIFEPFFTTKKNTGTGLGLWVSREIIQKHGGEIFATCPMDGKGIKGTQFVILLPSSIAGQAVA